MHCALALCRKGRCMPNSSKYCVICGKDCDGQPRMKDVKGRYYHDKCLVREQDEKSTTNQQAIIEDEPLSLQETAVELDPTSLMNEITNEVMAGAGSQSKCDSCGFPMSAGSVVCMKCGFDSQSGFALEGDKYYESPPHFNNSFWDKASAVLTSKFAVGMAGFIIIIAIVLIILTISN